MGISVTLIMIGLAEKKFWPIGAMGGFMLIAISGVFAGDPVLNVAYQSTGTPIQYTLPPMMIFVFGALGFMAFVLTIAHGNDLDLKRWF